MNRGRTQIIYQYLPGRIFSVEEDGAGISSAQISELPGGKDNEVNPQVLAQVLSAELTRWDSPKRVGFPSTDAADFSHSYVAWRPDRVSFSLFPLQFFCQNQNCHRIVEGYTSEEVLRRAPSLKCPHCRGKLKQIPYIQIHQCGHIARLAIPECKKDGHGRAHIYLDDHGSFVTSNWRCRACGGAIVSGLRAWPCPECKDPADQYMQGAVYRDPITFFGRTINFVNFQAEELDIFPRTTSGGMIMLASATGVFHNSKINLKEALSEKVADVSRETTTLEEMLKDMPPGAKRDAWEKKIADKKGQSGKVKLILDNFAAATGHGIKLGEIANASPSLREYAILLKNRPPVTIGDIIKEAEDNSDLARAAEAKAQFTALKDLGLETAGYLTDFPIALAAYGYTRRYSDVNQATLRAFPEVDLGNSNYRVPIYTTATKTEAVLLTLDPWQVTAWLKLNNQADYSKLPAQITTEELKAWLFSNLPGLHSTQAAPQNNKELLALELIHSISHALLINTSSFSGFEPSTLSEYLFPANLSFIIFVNGHSSFIIGGLVNLVKYHLDAWMERTVQATRRCPGDPACANRTGACHTCLYLSIGCQYWNAHLTRKVLYGGLREDGQRVVGYWDASTKNETAKLKEMRKRLM